MYDGLLYECGNEPVVSVKCREFLSKLRDQDSVEGLYSLGLARWLVMLVQEFSNSVTPIYIFFFI
jgi:hypothetical protein